MEKEMKKIIDELIFIGYNIKHIGTLMMAECIKIIISSPNIEIINDLENNVYTRIAENYNTNAKAVKANLVNATNYMYDMNDANRIKEYFGFYEDTKPTPKVVINTIIRKID